MYQGEDRVQQVNWLKELAGDIATYSGAEIPSQAQEAVETWLDWGTSDQAYLPGWFDGHDLKLLVQWVAEHLGGTEGGD